MCLQPEYKVSMLRNDADPRKLRPAYISRGHPRLRGDDDARKVLWNSSSLTDSYCSQLVVVTNWDHVRVIIRAYLPGEVRMSSLKLLDTLRRLNQHRLAGVFTPVPMMDVPISIVEKINQAQRRLALIVGTAHAGMIGDLLEGLAGHWQDGTVHGQLVERGAGRPGFVWDPDGSVVPVQFFQSAELREHWSALDEIATRPFVRLLVPVETDGQIRIANIYALPEPSAGESR